MIGAASASSAPAGLVHWAALFRINQAPGDPARVAGRLGWRVRESDARTGLRIGGSVPGRPFRVRDGSA